MKQGLLGLAAVVGHEAEARAQGQRAAVDGELEPLDRALQGLGLAGGAGKRGSRQKEAELVAAQTPDGIGAADLANQIGRQIPQDAIAGIVAEAVVDRLETVEVA